MDGVSISRDTQISVAASAMFPGFRFSPTDEELISYYLRKKLEGSDRCVEVIADIDFCKFEPWDLPAKSVIHSDSEWFFFSARGRKYPNGSQSRRATELGYWKATGKERNVKSGTNVIGTKRTLVFHVGRAPKGERTEWIMHEYCMTGQSQDSMVVCRLRRNTDFRPNENGSRVSQGRRNLSNNDNGNDYGTRDGGTDREGSSGKGKAVESSSSYDSHSVEQNDAVSGTEQKQSNSFVVAESSSRLKDSGDEEDCYADILKDDIINLDESALSGTLDLIYSEQTSHQSLQSTTTTVPSLGTSSESSQQPSQPSMATSYRRNRPAGGSSGAPGGKEAQKYTVTIDLSPKCLINGFRTGHYLISIVLLIFSLLALCCCLCDYCYH